MYSEEAITTQSVDLADSGVNIPSKRGDVAQSASAGKLD